jgi:5-methylcytosine-specific restriction endonuclease McrA
MRIELWILLATGLVMFNVYTEGKYLKLATQYKKYYQMAAIAVVGLFIYYMVKKNPLSWGPMLATTNDYLKYMPIDKGTSKILSPILDFTSRQNYQRDQTAYGGSVPVLPVDHLTSQEQRLQSSGLARPGQKVKRSVSETKKKFVAARQGWKCGDCQLQLNAWFEVDHKMRLEHGGSNHIDNLVALCRDCHGKKTTIENL